MMPVNNESVFEQARALARQGNLVVVRKDGKYLLLPAVPASSVKPEMKAAVEQIIPPTVKRLVAVMGDTLWASSDHPKS